MPDTRRPRLPGAPVLFTVALAERGSRTLVEHVDRLREAVRPPRAARPFGIEAWVVLPDRLHCVWRLPEEDADYATRWRLIKSRFSMGLPVGRLRPSHVARQERGVWQRRFWERHVWSDEALGAAVRTCWINPVKHGLVERPEGWAWSSIHRDRPTW